MKDILIHCLAAMLLALLALTGGVGLAFSIALMFLSRELAQRDKSNLWVALAGMPSWHFSKHAEWLAPGLAAFVIIAFMDQLKGP